MTRSMPPVAGLLFLLSALSLSTYSAIRSPAFSSRVVAEARSSARGGAPCTHPALGRMIRFLEKEKTRILAAESRELDAAMKVAMRADTGADPGVRAYLLRHERDLRTRYAETLAQSKAATRLVATGVRGTEAPPLSREALDRREYVLRRIEDFPYRNRSPLQDARARDASSRIGVLELLRDQYIEVSDWQSAFLRECRGESPGAEPARSPPRAWFARH